MQSTGADDDALDLALPDANGNAADSAERPSKSKPTVTHAVLFDSGLAHAVIHQFQKVRSA